MTMKNRICFQKINGKTPKGKRLVVLVNGSVAKELLIQPNIGIGKQTHARIIGSYLFDEGVAHKLNGSGNYEDIIQKIERTVRT